MRDCGLFPFLPDKARASMQTNWHTVPTRVFACLLLLLLFSFQFPLPVSAQQAVGVVTGLQGRVDLSRQPAPTPVPLRFRDDLFLRDVINTQQESVARMLFGGQSTVTVRELTRLEVRAELLPTGATRSTYDLADGKIRVNIAPKLLRPGDLIEIRTPNAVATVRGSVLIAEYISAIGRSLFTLIAGSAIITPAGQAPFILGPNSEVTISGTLATGTQAGPIETVTAAAAAEANKGLEVGPAYTAEANLEQVAEAQLNTATQLATVLVGAPVSPAEAPVTVTAPVSTEVTTAPIQSEVTEPVSEVTAQPFPLILPGPTPLVLSGTTVSQPAPTSLIELAPGATVTISTSLLDVSDSTLNVDTNVLLVENATLTSTTTAPLLIVDPSTVSVGGNLVLVGSGGTLSLSGPLLSLTGTPASEGTAAVPSSIASTGALVTVSGDGQFKATITGTDPLVTLQASTLTSGGPLLDLQNSSLNLVGPVARLTGGSTLRNTAGPVIRISGGTLTADALATTDGAGNTFSLTGTLLELATNTTVTLRTVGESGTPDTDVVTFALGAGEPLIRVTSSSLTLTGAGESLVDFGTDTGTSITQTGVGLIATGTAATPSRINLAGALLDLGGVNLTDTNPQLQLTHTTVTQTGSNSLIDVFGLPVTVAGPLLQATDSTLTTAGRLLLVGNATLTGTGTAPLLRFDPSIVTTGQNFLRVGAGGALILAGPLLSAVNTTFKAGDPTANLFSFLTVLDGANLTSTRPDPLVEPGPLVQLSGGSVETAGNFLTVRRSLSDIVRSTVTLAGPLLSATGTTFRTVSSAFPGGGTCCSFLFVAENARFEGRGSAPLLQLTNSTITTGGSFVNVTPSADLGDATPAPATLTLAGPLVTDSGSTFNITGGYFVRVRDGSTLTSSTAAPLLQFSNSTVNTEFSIFNVRSQGVGTPGSTVTLAGPVLRATGSSFTTGTDANFFTLRDGSTFTSETLEPLLELTGSSVTVPGFHFIRIARQVPGDGGSGDPVSATLDGPLLRLTDSAVTAIFDLVNIRDRATFRSNTTAPLIQLGGTVGTTITLGGTDPETGLPAFSSLFNLSGRADLGTTATAELAGPLFSSTRATITTAGDTFRVLNGGTLTSASAAPLIQVGNTTVTAGTPERDTHFFRVGFLSGGSPATVSLLAGPLLSATDSTLTVKGDDFLEVTSGGKLTGTGTAPLIQLTGSAVTTVAGSGCVGCPQAFLHLTGVAGGFASTISLDVPLLGATDSSLTTVGELLLIGSGSRLITSSMEPLIQASGSTATIGRDLLRVSDSGQLIAGGSLLRGANGSTVSTTDGGYINASSGGLVLIPGAALESVGVGNSVTINNAIVFNAIINGIPVRRTNGAFISLGPNTGLTGVTVVSPDSVIAADGIGTLVTIDPVLLPSGPVLSIQNTPSVPLGSSALATFGIGLSESILPGPPLTVTALADQGIAQLNGPTIAITNSTVTSATDFITLSGTSLAIPGPLLQITNSTLDNTAGFGDLLFVASGSIIKTFGTAPLIQINPSTVKAGDVFVFVDVAGILSLSAPLVTATDSTLTSGADFVEVSGALTSTTTQPLIQLTNSPVTTFDEGCILFIEPSSGTVNLSGPVLNATNSNLTIADSIVQIFFGKLTSTSTNPLVSLSGGIHSIGTDPVGTSPGFGNIFELVGFATDPVTGLGTGRPLQTGGKLFEATGGATVNVKASGHALKMDKALLEASAPIISLIGSATAQTSLSTGSSTMELFKSNVMSVGPVVALDNGLISVKNGPLLNLTGGTKMTVSGDLLSLINGSKINVLNGTLVSVDGTGSSLSVSQALVNFGGTGGNTIVVNNTISPNVTLTQTGLSGVGVFQGAGSSISIGPNPVKNPTLGSISVTGSLISATNGGAVNIAAP